MNIDIPTYEFIDDKPSEKAIISQMLKVSGLTLTDAIKKHNKLYPDSSFTAQNVSNKLSRNSLKLHDFAALAESCGFKLTLVNTNDNFVVRPKRKTGKIMIKNMQFNQLVDEGYCEARSINWESAIIVGENCNDAAVWLDEHLTDDLTIAGELKLYLDINQLFGVTVKPLTTKSKEEE